MNKLSTIQTQESVNTQEWGTFKDSLRMPIHNWFPYPAGFSYKAVESSLQHHGIKPGQVVYDPFMGSGTTNLVAKKLAINSYGVEAHPLVFRITRTKMNWDLDKEELAVVLREVETQVRNRQHQLKDSEVQGFLEQKFPPLVLKCYGNSTLLELLWIRDAIIQGHFSPTVTDFLFVGLTSILRQVSTVSTGWPYIAPNKLKSTSLNKPAWDEFYCKINKMLSDIQTTVAEANPNYQASIHQIVNADSRCTQELIPHASVDHVFTSPPYLNNFDYADRTRLELYFWGEANNWGEISTRIRSKLITSATTQIVRSDPRYQLSPVLQEVCPEVFDILTTSVSQLGKIRLTRGGKKSYDYLVAGYFNEMFQVLTEVYRVLKNDTKAILVLGDSAPYGVHIPTDDLIGKLGVGVGFSEYRLAVLRERGGKWKGNPQRHEVSLRESIVTLVKR